jgi:hypothetical protein
MGEPRESRVGPWRLHSLSPWGRDWVAGPAFFVPFSGPRGGNARVDRNHEGEERFVPDKRPSVKNEKQYEALKDKGMSKERAARIANSPKASSRGGKKSGSGGDSRQGGTTAQKKAAGRKGGRATARKRS